MRPAPPRVAVLGPTASGKSAVAMHVARHARDVELVSVDSMQVYRGMDVGTAKPSAAELAEIRHHLIDLVEPSEEFSVAEFRRHHDDVLDDLVARGRRAVLVGGTGLYHRVVIDDLEPPGRWPELHAELEERLAARGPEALHRRLTELDPAAAAKMEPTNARRIVRALEVCLGSGRPFSSFGPGLDGPMPDVVPQIGLRWPREVLASRIAVRVHDMIAAGFVDEVADVLERGPSRTARQALGYRELIEHLEGRCSLDAAIDLTIARTRRFATRQERWFRRDPRVRWVDVDDDPVAEAAPLVLRALEACTTSGRTSPTPRPTT